MRRRRYYFSKRRGLEQDFYEYAKKEHILPNVFNMIGWLIPQIQNDMEQDNQKGG